MNLFWREMKAARKSLIGWCVGVMILVIAGMSKFGGFSDASESLNSMVEAMPKSLQVIFGMSSLDISTAGGYFGVLFLYLMFMGTIHALMLGTNIISKEERDKTAEFLNAKPISRTRIISFKFLAALVNILIFNMVTTLSSIYSVDFYNKGEAVTREILLLMVGLFLLELLFLVLGMGIASVMKKPKSTAGVGTGLLLLSYILSVVIELNEKLDKLLYLTPFKYFDAKSILVESELDPVFVALSIVLIAVFLSVTYIFYRYRDLNV